MDFYRRGRVEKGGGIMYAQTQPDLTCTTHGHINMDMAHDGEISAVNQPCGRIELMLVMWVGVLFMLPDASFSREVDGWINSSLL